MSRFESSRFVRNPQVMHVDVLKSACDALGWQYSIQNNILTVSDAKQNSRLYGEFALKLNLSTNEVTYNTYYMPNASEKVAELQEQFYALNAVYSKKSLIQAFKKKGFNYKENDHFTPNSEEIYCFFMVGRSKDKNEPEPVAQIKFTILKDGTIVTDSDYLPNDVNECAHDAMDVLEQLLGNKRVMTKKTIPAKYAGRLKPRRITTQTIEQK